MAWKFTDLLSFHNAVDKFRVAKTPEGTKRVFISIGPGGKGSEYVSITPEEAQEFARYLIVEAHRAIENKSEKSPKRGTK